MFIPNFSSAIQYDFISALPENLDDITTELEARLVTAALSKYIVTPDRELAGTEAMLPNIFPERSDINLIFYVTPKEFETFIVELSTLLKNCLLYIHHVKYQKLIILNL